MADILGNALGQVGSVTKFAPDRFRSQFEIGLGYSSPNRFEVALPNINGMKKPDGSEISDDTTTGELRNMLCTAANIPGKNLETTTRQIGIEKRQIVTGHAMPNVLLTFYLTNTYSMKNYWDLWQSCCTSQDENGAMFVGYATNYVMDITLKQYTKNARKSYTVHLIDAYPINVNQIQLNNQPQSAVGEVTVELTYRTFVNDRSTGGLGSILEGLFT
jgi:hypothetical protein